MSGQCKDLSIAKYELLCSYSQSQLESFAVKNGYMTKPYDEGTSFYCGDNFSFAVTDDGFILIPKKSLELINRFISTATKIGYSYSSTIGSKKIYRKNKFIISTGYEEDLGKYYIGISSKSEDNDDDISNEKVFAKKLPANRLSVDSYTNTTHINVKKGDKISLIASGEVVVGAWAGSSGPDGIQGYESYSCHQDFKHGSLLMKIGNGEWQKAGSSKSYIAQTSGVLQLSINDCEPENNSGAYTVEYHISKAK